MKNSASKACFLAVVLFSVSAFAAGSVSAANRIEGTVYDPERRPVNDVQIELQNDVGSLLSTTKTRSGGRFTFSGVSAGRYLIKVIPVGLAYLEETTSVDVINYGRANSSDTAYVDIYLRFDKRAQDQLLNRQAEVVFVQEVPDEAKKMYLSGIEEIKTDREKGLNKLKRAIELFPTYFDALSLLGREYLFSNDFREAYPYLIRAVDINPRSFASYYNLGYAFYYLNEISAGLLAARAAIMLAPADVDARVLYGILLRVSSKDEEAISELLKANSLSRNENPEAHWQLALVYNKLGRNEDAAKELELYIKVKPNIDPIEKKKTRELIQKLRGSKKK